MKQGIPKYIYKYVSFDYLCNILQNKTLNFKKPKDFNDPFEGKFYVKSFSQTQIDELKKNLPNHIKALFNQESVISQHIQIVDFFEAIINLNGYCCFSKNFDNLLMWAHYTRSHNGACLKFDTEKLIKSFPIIKAVTYSDNYEDLDIYSDLNKSIEDIPFRKSKHWKYEEEVRIKSTTVGDVPLDIECIEEVILGLHFRNTVKTFEKIIYNDKTLKFKVSAIHASSFDYTINNNYKIIYK